VHTVRVIVTANPPRVLVAHDSTQGPEVIFAEDYDPATLDISTYARKEATPGTEAFLTTTSGKQLAFLKDSSCGCGSRLKSWNPFRTLTA